MRKGLRAGLECQERRAKNKDGWRMLTCLVKSNYSSIKTYAHILVFFGFKALVRGFSLIEYTHMLSQEE